MWIKVAGDSTLGVSSSFGKKKAKRHPHAERETERQRERETGREIGRIDFVLWMHGRS
jgi:hypothetical protein